MFVRASVYVFQSPRDHLVVLPIFHARPKRARRSVINRGAEYWAALNDKNKK